MDFIAAVKFRNEDLFWFGLLNFLAVIVFLIFAKISTTQVMGVNAWYKPFKFALSTFLYAWAMAWYCYYLPSSFNIKIFNWVVIAMLGFEVAYIALQASRGQLSHYNISSAIYANLFSLMALAATIVSLYTAYVSILFFANAFPELPNYYLWSIRIGLILFVIFSFEGFVMGANMAHTIGAPDGGKGLPILNWSLTHGDARISHFIGMHALQVMPLLSFYLFKDVRATMVMGLAFGALAIVTLLQALQGKPFHKF